MACALAAAGALALAGALSGCNDKNPVAAPGAVHVLTDASSYAAGTPVHSILVNDSESTVYTLSCTDNVRLEVQEASGWKDLGTGWYFGCDGPTVPVPLEPGGFRDLPVLDGAATTGFGAGTYRFRVAVYQNDTLPYLPISEDQRVSKPFTIKDKNQ